MNWIRIPLQHDIDKTSPLLPPPHTFPAAKEKKNRKKWAILITQRKKEGMKEKEKHKTAKSPPPYTGQFHKLNYTGPSTRMLDNLTLQQPALHRVSQLLGHGLLHVVPLITPLYRVRDVDVDCGALTCQHLNVGVGFAQVYRATVALVDLDRGRAAVDLERERVGFDDVDRGHEVVDDHTRLGALVDGHRINFAVDLDHSVFTAEDKDGLVDFDVLEYESAFVFVVLLMRR